MNLEQDNLKQTPINAKKVFKKLGTCSKTFFYILNREFGFPKELEERAADPLAGGIMKQGRQCGMLWGATLAVGAESFRRCETQAQAIAMAITATQQLVDSFLQTAKNVNCRELIHADLTTKWGMIKLLLLKSRSCLNLTEKWAPEAIKAARKGLSIEKIDYPEQPLNCASEVAKRMGASEKEIVTVAGLAGGLGLSGGGCGALGAAVWLKTLDWCRKNPGKSAFENPDADRTLKTFLAATDSEILCHKLAGQRFNSINEHTEFIKNGGCEKLIDGLAN